MKMNFLHLIVIFLVVDNCFSYKLNAVDFLQKITNPQGSAKKSELKCSTSDSIKASPIDLSADDADNINDNGAITLENYNKPMKTLASIYLGHSFLYVTGEEGKKHSVKHTATKSGFIFSFLQIIWPSLHKINGQSYDLELQITHQINIFNTSLEQAALMDDGFLIFVIFFRKGDTSNEPIARLLRYKKQIPEQPILVEDDIILADLLPDNKSHFVYRSNYEDQLCEKSVIWVVFDNVLSISDRDMQELLRIRLEATDRKIKDRKGREVMYYGSNKTDRIEHSLLLILLSIIWRLYDLC